MSNRVPLDIARLLNRAEECRVLARLAGDEMAMDSYLLLADHYETFAEEERRLIAVQGAVVIANSRG